VILLPISIHQPLHEENEQQIEFFFQISPFVLASLQA
jgi:hypothetical protein